MYVNWLFWHRAKVEDRIAGRRICHSEESANCRASTNITPAKRAQRFLPLTHIDSGPCGVGACLGEGKTLCFVALSKSHARSLKAQNLGPKTGMQRTFFKPEDPATRALII